ncbi:uncharacterized protein DFL_003797 [Arthrobotrys flagrans]|uniref:Uncharacterized protein n=1 Tax=Arthrobotrys flagrans TaxID=97331 RepID=A0A437A2W6_ARTFL|nr:hypothetical protein DFL_003797 [Arthrobotrys flagrans]
MKFYSQAQSLRQLLTAMIFISVPLAQAEVVTIPFQTFKEGLKYSSDSTIGPFIPGYLISKSLLLAFTRLSSHRLEFSNQRSQDRRNETLGPRARSRQSKLGTYRFVILRG